MAGDSCVSVLLHAISKPFAKKTSVRGRFDKVCSPFHVASYTESSMQKLKLRVDIAVVHIWQTQVAGEEICGQVHFSRGVYILNFPSYCAQ